jgi:hypothetical protein
VQASHLPEALRIAGNISTGCLAVHAFDDEHAQGEDTVLLLFKGGGFDAVATDDARFIRRLRGLGVPYAVPAVIVVRLKLEGALTADQAMDALAALRQHISAEQHIEESTAMRKFMSMGPAKIV